jgi:hypothetical protein
MHKLIHCKNGAATESQSIMVYMIMEAVRESGERLSEINTRIFCSETTPSPNNRTIGK